jgi:Glycosyl hydrolase family 63 C-terminal domain
VVSLRYSELIGISSRIWQRRELLERTHMDAHKLPCSSSTTQCSLTSLTFQIALYILILLLLQTYAAQEGPYQAKAQTIYKELRRNVVDNVVKVGCPLFMKTLFFLLIQFKSGIRTYWICMGAIRCYYRRGTKKVCYVFMPSC